MAFSTVGTINTLAFLLPAAAVPAPLTVVTAPPVAVPAPPAAVTAAVTAPPTPPAAVTAAEQQQHLQQQQFQQHQHLQTSSYLFPATYTTLIPCNKCINKVNKDMVII